MTIRSLALVTALSAQRLFSADPTLRGVNAHEWGTFTTVADENGKPVRWIASLSNDLPCFVERAGSFGQKNSFPSLVRMETPVIFMQAAHAEFVDLDDAESGAMDRKATNEQTTDRERADRDRSDGERANGKGADTLRLDRLRADRLCADRFRTDNCRRRPRQAFSQGLRHRASWMRDGADVHPCGRAGPR